MPKIRYQSKSFNDSSREIIKKANEIIADYQAQGYMLTLRQLYYQFVAKQPLRVPFANNIQSYKRLGSIINDARLAGMIDWNAIEDRTRNLETLPSWASPREILESCSHQFRYDRWKDQPRRVEVWVEKEALVGVVQRIANEYRLPFFACRGYVSQSETWGAGQRFLAYERGGQDVVVLHLGDHDPSGIDMTRDNYDRLYMFTEQSNVEVRRLALNYDQVEQYNPPPNPAKLTDSRATAYIERFGNESWELDALEPSVIAELVRSQMPDLIDWDLWEAAIEREDEARARLAKLAKNWKD
jgi:hypothetical protein